MLRKLIALLLSLFAVCQGQTPPTQNVPTYSKGANIQVFWNTGDASMVCGSPTKNIVSLLRYSVTGIVPHVSGHADVSIATEIIAFRLSSLPVGGTFMDRHGTANDSADGTSSTATMRDYYTPPATQGTIVDGPTVFYLALPSGNNPSFAPSHYDLVAEAGGKPITLHGTNDCIVMFVNRDYYVSDDETLPSPSYILAFRAEWNESN